jgi:exonuclease SbcC
MSYKESKLDLSLVKVACLTGLNGAGKSALFDALTWTLWEQARGSSDELMRIGQKEMSVEVSFEIEGQLFRVIRTRNHGQGKAGSRIQSKGTLELQAYIAQKDNDTNGGNGGKSDHEGNGNGKGGSHKWKSLTNATMRETQKRINELLKMDYSTFANSVYLRQGKADEFTCKGPTERKQVLAEILGLDYFDTLQKLAKEELQIQKARQEVLKTVLGDTGVKEEILGKSQTEVSSLQSNLEEVENQIADLESELAENEKQSQSIAIAEERIKHGKARLSEFENEIRELKEQENALLAHQETIMSVLTNAEQIESDYATFAKYKEELESIDGKSFAYNQLQTDLLKLQGELTFRKSKLESELEYLLLRQSELSAKLAKLAKSAASGDKLQSEYQKLQELLVSEQTLAGKQEMFTKYQTRMTQLSQEIIESRIHLEAELDQKQELLTQTESLLASANILTQEYTRLQEEVENLDKLEAEFELVEQNGMSFKAKLASLESEIADLKQKQAENNQKIVELQEHSGNDICPLCASVIVDRKSVIERYHQMNSNWDQEIASRKESISEGQTKLIELRQDYRDLSGRLDTRKSLDNEIGKLQEKLSALSQAEATCQFLNEQIAVLKKRLECEDFAQTERQSSIAIKLELDALDFDPIFFSNLQAQIRMSRNVEIRWQQRLRDLQEQEKLTKELESLTGNIEQIKTSLENGSFACDLPDKITDISTQLSQTDYDPDKHQKLKLELSSRLPAQEGYQMLKKAEHEHELSQDNLKRIKTQLDNKTELIQELETDLQTANHALLERPSINLKIVTIQTKLAEALKEKSYIKEQQAVLTDKVARIQQELTETTNKHKELQIIQDSIDDYTFLVEAFGKKGIQAIIIENTIPEIEAEANHLLSQLSDNQMHVALISQTETKQGNLVETLDLVIADEHGTRGYELYSGGEAFKVDFAIRLALSRLLARRSGAPLETLIIDEGFGSQDQPSRSKLIKAINSIKNDFARILVITHIAEVKEKFTSEIRITKESGHSEIEMAISA